MLLSVIGGRAPKRTEVAGLVTVDGAAFGSVARRRIGYVLQAGGMGSLYYWKNSDAQF